MTPHERDLLTKALSHMLQVQVAWDDPARVKLEYAISLLHDTLQQWQTVDRKVAYTWLTVAGECIKDVLMQKEHVA